MNVDMYTYIILKLGVVSSSVGAEVCKFLDSFRFLRVFSLHWLA
jgi:hypothetical protein